MWYLVIIFIIILVIIYFSWNGKNKESNNKLDYTPVIDPELMDESEMTECSDIDYSLDIKFKNLKMDTCNLNGDSKGENYCRSVLEKLFNRPFPKVRPDFLNNPETGKNLEIDCYNEELKLGLEYNGIQHYCWPNFTKQTKEEFIQQRRRDLYKIEQCNKLGIYLIPVPYNVPYNLIPQFIINYLPLSLKKNYI